MNDPQPAPRYPGLPSIVDGSEAIAQGGAVIDANLAVIEAAYDRLIDVTTSLDAPPVERAAPRLEPEGAIR